MRRERERGVRVAQATRNLGLHVNVLRTWGRECQADPAQDFPGEGRQSLEAAEVARLKLERDILEEAAAYFAKESM